MSNNQTVKQSKCKTVKQSKKSNCKLSRSQAVKRTNSRTVNLLNNRTAPETAHCEFLFVLWNIKKYDIPFCHEYVSMFICQYMRQFTEQCTKLKCIFLKCFWANMGLSAFIWTQWTRLIHKIWSNIHFHKKMQIHSVISGEPLHIYFNGQKSSFTTPKIGCFGVFFGTKS